MLPPWLPPDTDTMTRLADTLARIAFRVLVDGKTVEVRAGEVLSAAILNACAGKLDKLQGARFVRTEFVEL